MNPFHMIANGQFNFAFEELLFINILKTIKNLWAA